MTIGNNLYSDIDMYGRESRPGMALEFFDIDATSNALLMWLTSKKGDFIRNPGAGGILEKYLFKNINNEKLFKIKIELMSSFRNYFSGSLVIDDIMFKANNEDRILEIKLVYHDIRTGISNNVVAYVNSDFASKRFEYEEIAYVEENLYRFVQLTIPSYSIEKIVFDTTMLVWRWGKYKFNNFSTSDTYFSQILGLING